MLAIENKPIRDAALAIPGIEKVALQTDLAHARTVQQIYEKAGVSRQQVSDVIKALVGKGLLNKMREKQGVVYWRNEPMTDEQLAAYYASKQQRRSPGRPKGIPNKAKTDITAEHSQPRVATGLAAALLNTIIPEILVNENSITILHAKCKITVEFNHG
jgi:DNA-binding IscR family transcriptional regulator